MKLYIPEIGDTIKLVAPWTFNLYNEHRNDTLIEIGEIKFPDNQSSFMQSVPFIIPAGEVLKIDRIYIRKGSADYSSLSFLWKGMKTKKRSEPRYATVLQPGHPMHGIRQHVGENVISAKPVRFWAKLSDVNNIEFEQE